MVFTIGILAFGIRPVSAVTITPASTSALLNMPITFTVTGLNESSNYDVELDDSAIVTAYSPSTGGQMTFSLTVTTAGNHKVEVIDNFDTSVVATANVMGEDIMPVLIGAITILITVSIVFSIYRSMEDVV